MLEYQIIVGYGGAILFRTCWKVGKSEARDLAWLMASKLGPDYDVGVGVREESFVAIPWEQFGLDLPHN